MIYINCLKRFANLRRDTVSNKVMKKFFVVKCKNVLDQTQHVDGRVGEILEPVLAPTCYRQPTITITTIIIIITIKIHHWQ